ncbi:Glycolipid transfer protein [Papilio xuthus]|uniref:Glycolipid transfer protein n=1 Tax=Papilio xuthus TaxID=66420 RepID=A0A194Q8R5_PAPXU|nr:Glycolipid transfer protein [Papilio xuthus]
MAANIVPNKFILEEINYFPSVVNGRINFILFIKASSDLLILIGMFSMFNKYILNEILDIYIKRFADRLGKIFTPVKQDIQGNIDKINKYYKYDENSCLLELMLEEVKNGKPLGAEGVLWLNRALLFFELTFHGILDNLKSDPNEVNMKKVYISAYEGSVKKYHGWMTQQLFNTMCRMAPTLPQIIKSFEVENNINIFESKLSIFNEALHLVRWEIDKFFENNNLFTNNFVP